MYNNLQLTEENISAICEDIMSHKTNDKFINEWNHTHELILKEPDIDTNDKVKEDTFVLWYL